ncbi:hypothetical protein N658DRAFT_566013 [Parathielavia hyrcaniae]|uniref:Uncharacterized protein n=1 Tax=Parathielavia hyrcaniae TaxID=113614 RepID=A0AAN6Q2J0_9PEZI|nr:hypothetical protein N658DRAFT_566013 [Parathielavia hyrcaniae]
MASYHRILLAHGRSVKHKTVECDYDIHPWDILVNGERWAGKVRLVGFVDAFYLICYSGQSRFEHGIVVYKAELPRYFGFDSTETGGLDYKITSLGHPISLKTKYPQSSLRKYDIKLRKGRDTVMKKRVKRGVSQHDLFDLLHDALRLSIITHAELLGLIIGKTIGGSTLEDVASKYFEGLAGGRGSRNLLLSGEKM